MSLSREQCIISQRTTTFYHLHPQKRSSGVYIYCSIVLMAKVPWSIKFKIRNALLGKGYTYNQWIENAIKEFIQKSLVKHVWQLNINTSGNTLKPLTLILVVKWEKKWSAFFSIFYGNRGRERERHANT